MVQGVSADADVLAIDDDVTLALRLYARERGIPVYGYKAFRVVDSSVSSGTPGAPGASGASGATNGSSVGAGARGANGAGGGGR
jgi:hypothetical protein